MSLARESRWHFYLCPYLYQTYEEIGRRLGVTGAAIKKAAKRLGIELPVRRYKNDSEHFNKKDKPKRYCAPIAIV